jgi:iron-sulfur cluster repair protein YtfE (RIC family)
MTNTPANTPYEGATPEQLRHHLVQEFLAIHNMFRDQLGAILDFTNALIAGQQRLDDPETRARIQTVIRAGTQYTQYLHHHHHLESAGLFPALAEQGMADEVVKRLVAEHDEIAVLIDQFHAAVGQAAAVEPAVLNNDLRRLSDALRAHLAYEETHVCPLIARMERWPFM